MSYDECGMRDNQHAEIDLGLPSALRFPERALPRSPFVVVRVLDRYEKQQFLKLCRFHSARKRAPSADPGSPTFLRNITRNRMGTEPCDCVLNSLFGSPRRTRSAIKMVAYAC